MDIVINACYGGYSLSLKAMEWLRERGCIEAMEYPLYSGEAWESGHILTSEKAENHKRMNTYRLFSEEGRDNPYLVACVLELGEEANGAYAELKVVGIPDDVQWEIEEYDGWEHVAEVHRTWG